jgi:hypothetical protein
MESFGDYLLVGRGSIFDPKRHYNPYKSPPISNNDDFVLVLQCYENMTVSKKTIKNGINFMFDYSVNNLINKR